MDTLITELLANYGPMTAGELAVEMGWSRDETAVIDWALHRLSNAGVVSENHSSFHLVNTEA